MSKVILFYPSVQLGRPVRSEHDLPLSLLAIATPLHRRGYKVEIIDQRVDRDWRDLLVRALTDDVICVGITSMTGPQIQQGLSAARLVRRNSVVPIVWGGIHPTLRPEETVEHDLVDIVVVGEGEATFPELVRTLEIHSPLDGIHGILFKHDGRITRTAPRALLDLNTQPPLAYHLIDIEKYYVTFFGKRHLLYETSRGCPFRCSYCYNSGVYGPTWRFLNFDATLQGIDTLVTQHGAEGITLVDDNFFIDKQRAMDILRQVQLRCFGIQFAKLDIALRTLATFTDADWALIKESGCTLVNIGVESGSPRALDMLNKRVDIDLLILLNRKFKDLEVTPVYLFMVGYPTEIRLLRENPQALARVHIYAPFPGTALFDIAVENGLRMPTKLEEWVAFNFRSTNERAAWLSPERRKLIRMLHFTALFRDFIHSYRKTSPLVALLARLYYPIARKRIEKLFCRFPIEMKVAEALGLYPRQV
jgi:anaerobic magnesium-protoporphyrin IX monomethyl ester cyclase